MTAVEIANAINKSGEKYYGFQARGWSGEKESRVYFGCDYVSIESDGEIHNRVKGKARAKSIGEAAVILVEKYSKNQ